MSETDEVLAEIRATTSKELLNGGFQVLLFKLLTLEIDHRRALQKRIDALEAKP